VEEEGFTTVTTVNVPSIEVEVTTGVVRAGLGVVEASTLAEVDGAVVEVLDVEEV